MANPFTWLKNLLAGFKRGIWRDDPLWYQKRALPYDVSGLLLTEDQALSISVVWACIDAIAKALASCKWNIYQPQGPGRRQLVDDHQTSWILNCRANPEMTAISFREAMLYTAIPFGNAYAEIVRDRAGRVAQLWPLYYERVLVRRNYETGEVEYHYYQQDGQWLQLPVDRVFHLRGPGLNGLMGENIIARAIKSISVAAAQERFAASFFGMGAHPSGILKAPAKVDADTHKRLQKDWAEKRGGPENAHKPMILEAGWSFEAMTIDPQKSQAVESRQFSVEEICRWFGVPPHKVQHLARATFSNIEHQSIEFVRDALTPWARRLEQEADYKLFRQDRAPFFCTVLDTAPLSYGDAYSRAQAQAIWRQNGIMSANEIRHREGMNDAGDDGDVLLVQKNMATIDQIVNPPAPALPPGAKQPAGGDGENADEEQAEKDSAPAGGEGGAESEDDEIGGLVREAVVAMLGTAFTRHAKRMAARRADLSRAHPPERVEELLAEHREKLRPLLEAECAPALEIARKARLGLSADVHRLACWRLEAGAAPDRLAAELAAGVAAA